MAPFQSRRCQIGVAVGHMGGPSKIGARSLRARGLGKPSNRKN